MWSELRAWGYIAGDFQAGGRRAQGRPAGLELLETSNSRQRYPTVDAHVFAGDELSLASVDVPIQRDDIEFNWVVR